MTTGTTSDVEDGALSPSEHLTFIEGRRTQPRLPVGFDEAGVVDEMQ